MKYRPSSKKLKNERWDSIKASYSWSPDIDYRANPYEYKVGKGEQGVLICEPYKSEILPYWRFKTPDYAIESSNKIFSLFQEYLENEEFVGADMARKFLQMGYTRARRYANHKGGRKYDKETGEELPRSEEDREKAESARIFYERWKEAEEHEEYKNMKAEWKINYG
jgi:hypothetical protein